MIIRKRTKDEFVMVVNRSELESIWGGLSWTIDQMSGVDNVDQEKEMSAFIKPFLFGDSTCTCNCHNQSISP